MLVRAGLEALTEKGFSSTGIDEVLKRVGVPKGSFYHYFDCKEAFGAELIDRYARYFAHKLERHFGDASRQPLDRLWAWRRLGSDLDISKLETISTEISLGEAIPAASKLINGEIRGRVIVDVNR